MDALKEIIAQAPDDLEILNAWLVTDERLNNCHKALCSVSGGSDSDIVTHLCASLDIILFYYHMLLRSIS